MKLFEKIINNSLNINAKNNKSMTALMYAVDKCDIRIIELLLEKGAIINLKDNKGRTALDIAKHKLNKKIKKEKEDKLMIVLKNKLLTESIEKTVDLSGKTLKKKNKM